MWYVGRLSGPPLYLFKNLCYAPHMITKAIASWKRRINYPNKLRFSVPKVISDRLNWHGKTTLLCDIGNNEIALRPLKKNETVARFFRESRYSLIELELEIDAKDKVAMSTVDGEMLLIRFFNT